MGVRYGASWRTGNGTRSWVSMPLWLYPLYFVTSLIVILLTFVIRLIIIGCRYAGIGIAKLWRLAFAQRPAEHPIASK